MVYCQFYNAELMNLNCTLQPSVLVLILSYVCSATQLVFVAGCYMGLDYASVVFLFLLYVFILFFKL